MVINREGILKVMEGSVGKPIGVASPAESIQSFVSIVSRQLPIFLVVIPCVMALGLLYLMTTPRSYTAVGKMLLDTHKTPTLQRQEISSDAAVDNLAVATQVEVLTSENVSLAVIRNLKLTEDPEFVGPDAESHRLDLQSDFERFLHSETVQWKISIRASGDNRFRSPSKSQPCSSDLCSGDFIPVY